MENGGEDGAVVAEEVLSKEDVAYGYNVSTREYGNMLRMGVIDPVKVVRTALANAASIAGLMLTTEALVTNFEKEDKEKPRVEGAIA